MARRTVATAADGRAHARDKAARVATTHRLGARMGRIAASSDRFTAS